MWLAVSLLVAAYALGSISPALIAAERAGVDLYAAGSGNPGATNVGRVLGKRTGRLVLVLDVLKGLVPTGAALAADLPAEWVGATGFSAALGHCYPVWHRFRGGKGAATAAGAMLAAAPAAGAVAVLLYLVLKRVTRRASVGSLAGALGGAAIAQLLALDPDVARLAPRVAVEPGIAWMAWGIAALVVARHTDNIARLLRGTEPES